MNKFIIFLIIFSVFMLFVLWTMLVVAKQADEKIEEEYNRNN